MFSQYEMVRGTTHWIAWFDAELLKVVFGEGFQVLHHYPNTVLVRGKDGRLVPPNAVTL